MSDPWSTIPLADYEGHMASDGVGQAAMLASALKALLARHRPQAVAVVGCAGGNGFGEAARAGVTRLVGIDINARYLDEARRRHAGAFPHLELLCADIAGPALRIEPVDLVSAALVLEYVDLEATMPNLARLCRAGGVLAALVQLPSEDGPKVSPSAFTSLAALTRTMTLVPPERVRDAAQRAGFEPLSDERIALVTGKRFASLTFRAGARA